MNMKAILKYFFPKPEPTKPLPPPEPSGIKAKYEALKAEHEALKTEHEKVVAGQVKLLAWVKTTHRLHRAPDGIRALIQEGKRIVPFLALLFIGQCLFAAPPPVLRNSWSTNTAGTPVRGVDNLSVTNAGSGTNWTFFGISPQTVARLMDVTNISGSALTTNANQFLGVPLSIKDGVLLTNTVTYSNLTVQGYAGNFADFLRSNSIDGGNFVRLYNIATNDNSDALLNFSTDSIGAGGGSGLLSARIGGRFRIHDHAQRTADLYFETRHQGLAAVPLWLTNGSALITNAILGDVIVIKPPGGADASLRIVQTNGLGYAEITTTNSVISTNRIVLSISSNTVSAGQLFKIHSTAISGGINNIVLTNGGGDGFYIASFNGFGTNTTLINPTNVGLLTVNDTNDSLRIGTNVNPLKGTGERNTFIGSHVANRFLVNSNGDGIAGSDNVGVGSFVMQNLTNTASGPFFGAQRNVAIGGRASQNLSNGTANISIGYSALRDNLSGANNIGIGDGSMFFGTSSGFLNNVGVGIETGLTLSNSSANNTLIGHHAGYGRSSPIFIGLGSENVYVGAHSGGEIRSNAVHNNTVAVGYHAGYNGGDNCLYLGNRAGQQNTNDNNVFYLDTQIRASYFAEKTNALLHGTFATTMPNQSLRMNGGIFSVPYGHSAAQRIVATNSSQSMWLDGSDGGLRTLSSDGSFFVTVSGAFLGFYTTTQYGVYEDKDFQFGSSGDNNAKMRWDTTQGTDTLVLGLDDFNNLGSRSFIIADRSDRNFNFAHAAQVQPTLFIHSTNQSTVQWLSLAHNSTNAVIQTGTPGAVVISNNLVGVSLGGSFTNAVNPIVNAGTAETNMLTVNLSANMLTNLNDRITFRAAIRFAATADNKAFTVTYGSEAIYSSGTVAQSGGDAVLHGEIIRTGNTSQSCNVGFNGNGAFDGGSTFETVQTNGIDTILKITATGAASGVITNRSLTVQYWPTR